MSYKIHTPRWRTDIVQQQFAMSIASQQGKKVRLSIPPTNGESSKKSQLDTGSTTARIWCVLFLLTLLKMERVPVYGTHDSAGPTNPKKTLISVRFPDHFGVKDCQIPWLGIYAIKKCRHKTHPVSLFLTKLESAYENIFQ